MSHRSNRAWIIIGVLFFATENMTLAKDLIVPDHICPPSAKELIWFDKMETSLKENMHTTQIAAESYALDHSGQYPTVLDNAFKAHFPGGEGKTLGNELTNPFTRAKEWPLIGKESDIPAIDKPGFSVPSGMVKYIPLDKGKSYLILGGVLNDTPLRNAGGRVFRLHPSK